MDSKQQSRSSHHGFTNRNGNGVHTSNGAHNGHGFGSNGFSNGHVNNNNNNININKTQQQYHQSTTSSSSSSSLQTPSKRSTIPLSLPSTPLSPTIESPANIEPQSTTKTTRSTTTKTSTTREQALAEANDVLNSVKYKQGRFENFNLLGVVTSPRMLDLNSSRHNNNNTNVNHHQHNNNNNGISSPSNMNSISSPNANNNTKNNTNTNTNTPSSNITSSLGLDSYVDPNFLSNVSQSITKEITSLNSTLNSYSRNYLGNYPSLSNTYAGLVGGSGVSSIGSKMSMGMGISGMSMGMGMGMDTSSTSSLDFENELLQSIMNDGENYKVRPVEELPKELVDLDLSTVEGHLRKCGMLAHHFDKELRRSKKNSSAKASTNSKNVGDHGDDNDVNDNGNHDDDGTDMIPEIFFSPFFDLTDPKTFESLLVLNNDDDIKTNRNRNGNGNNNGNDNDKGKRNNNSNDDSNYNDDNDPIIRIPKPEELTQYLDTIELGLLNQVRSKSDSFFRETNRFSYLKSLVADLVNEVKTLRGELEQIRERSITEVELIPVMDRRRKDIKILGEVLEEVMDVVEVKSSVAGLIAAGDFLGAVEAIHMARSLLNGKGENGRYALGKVVALNKVNDQLVQYENLVVMDLSNDVVELFLSWNDGNANTEMRVKVKHTILALKKCKKISTMADIYREKLCETIRVTIRTTVNECAFDAARDSKKSSMSSATIVSIPSKDGDESSTKASITEGVTSMSFEQFMDCLDMIFEQSLSLLRSASAVNKFCLEEGISLREDTSASNRDASALSAASDLSHKSISEILRLRKDAHSLITFEDMRRLWDSCLAFTLQVERISGQKAYGLRSTLLAQAKAFVERKHEANMSSLVAALDGERWSQSDVSAERQAALERLCTGRAVLSSTRDKGLSGGMGAAEASPVATVEGTRYRVVWSCLLLIEHIMSNVACAAHFQTLATNVVGKVSELLRLFNSRATQLVLGAGAIHSAARLKSINAKHLALVTQCVGIILAILPHVRAALMAQLPSKQHALLLDLDKIKKEYAEHHDKILSKFVGIIGGIVEHNLVSRVANTNFDQRSTLPITEELTPNSCCPFLDGTITNTRKMHQVLVSLLPSDDLMDVFSRIFSYLDSKVPKILIDADLDDRIPFKLPTTLEGKRRMVLEVRLLSNTLNKLPNVRPWDFGAMKFLERKLELPPSEDDVSNNKDEKGVPDTKVESPQAETEERLNTMDGSTIKEGTGNNESPQINEESNDKINEVNEDNVGGEKNKINEGIVKESAENQNQNQKNLNDKDGEVSSEAITEEKVNENRNNELADEGNPANSSLVNIAYGKEIEQNILDTGASTIETTRTVSSSSIEHNEKSQIEEIDSSRDEIRLDDQLAADVNLPKKSNPTHVTSPNDSTLSEYIRTS